MGRRTTAAPATLTEPASAPVRCGALVSSSLLSHEQIRELVDRFFGALRRPVRKNLAVLVHAFLVLTSALRSGNGELTLAAVARALPLVTSFKDRYKRLNRFLDNRLFDPQGLSDGLFAVLLGTGVMQSQLPVILDQSAVGPTQLLLAGIPVAGRILPLALITFTYADIQNRPDREKSQNYIERLFFLQLLEAATDPLRLCFILDRGYARVSLMVELLAQPRVSFILRTRRDVVVQRCKRGRWTRCRIGSLRAPDGSPRRLERVLYPRRYDAPVEVDLIVYYERGHKEPWYLVVPPGSASWLATGEVVRLYRQRMHIEQGFRDFKTHLGVRGLQLEVRVSERVQRLLMAFTLAYALVVAIGMSEVAQKARRRLEDPRPQARHGTDRILSVRTVAALLLGGLCTELIARLARTVDRLVADTLRGRGLYHLALAP